MVWTSGGGIDEAGVGRSCRNAVALRWAVVQYECESVQEVGSRESWKREVKNAGTEKSFQSPGSSLGFGLSHVGSPAKAHMRPETRAGLGRAQTGRAGLGFGL